MTLSTIESAEFEHDSTRSFGMNSQGDAKSGSGGGSNEQSNNRSELAKRQSANVLTRKERNTIKMSRTIVLFILVVAGISASVMTSRLTTDWESHDFENHVSLMISDDVVGIICLGKYACI